MEHSFYREESNNENRCSKENDKGMAKRKAQQGQEDWE